MLPTTLRDGAYVPKRVKEEIDFDGPIERGAKKMRAQRVQEFLTLNGFSVSIDADFGPATEKRVRDFQTARGLPASGIVDMKTHEELVAPIVKALNPIAAGERAFPLSPRPTPSSTSRTAQRKQAATIEAPGSGAISIGMERRQNGARALSALHSSRQLTHSAFNCRSNRHRPAMCWRWKPRPPESSCPIACQVGSIRQEGSRARDLLSRPQGSWRLGACRHRDRTGRGVVRHGRGEYG